jgi:GntR family galactonate operon transcriptional repressor
VAMALRRKARISPVTTTPSTTRPRIGKEVVAALARRILSGEWPPGTVLPVEAELCAEYGVSRTVVREATKILASKNLLRSRAGSGTQVLDMARWNRLDPELLDWSGDSLVTPRFVASLMEARRIVEPAAAELAAQRATAADLAALEDAYRRMQASLPDDVESCSLADLDFHTALLVASHNDVLESLAHVVRAAMLALFRLTTHLGTAHADALHLHAAIVEAVRLRRPDDAAQASRDMLAMATRDLERAQADG